MNKKIIGLSIAMLFAANGAYAQSMNGSSVELYGVLDLAIGNVQNSLSADSYFPATVNPYNATKSAAVSHGVTGMFNGGITPSRWGIRGTEDLGGGLKAIFNMDSYINAQSGSLSSGAESLANNPKASPSTVSAPSSVSGQLFNDQAWVGLSDATLGKVTFGRQWGLLGDIVRDYDAVQDAQLFSPLGFSGSFAGGGLTENKRQDSSIKYGVKVADFNLGLMAKLGGISGNSSAGSIYGISGGYEANGLGVQAGYQTTKDSIKGANSTFGTIAATNVNSEAYVVAAKYVFGDAKITGGFEEFKVKKPSDTLQAVGTTSYYGYSISNLPTVANTALCATGDAGNFCGADQKTDTFWIGGDYNFTPAFNLAVGFYDVNPKASSDYLGLTATGTPTTYKVNGNTVTPQAGGNIYEYSVLADYHFSKRTDVYGGVMYSQYKGDAFSSLAYNTKNTIVAFGLRTKF